MNATPMLVCQLPLGQVGVASYTCIGRGSPGMPDDPRLSRQHAIFSFDPVKASASVTWMAKRRGRVRSHGRCSDLECGSQRPLFHNDLLTLLADCGQHIVLVQFGSDDDPVPARPNARSWALLESYAVADARAAARVEVCRQTQSAQTLVDKNTRALAESTAALGTRQRGGETGLAVDGLGAGRLSTLLHASGLSERGPTAAITSMPEGQAQGSTNDQIRSEPSVVQNYIACDLGPEAAHGDGAVMDVPVQVGARAPCGAGGSTVSSACGVAMEAQRALRTCDSDRTELPPPPIRTPVVASAASAADAHRGVRGARERRDEAALEATLGGVRLGDGGIEYAGSHEAKMAGERGRHRWLPGAGRGEVLDLQATLHAEQADTGGTCAAAESDGVSSSAMMSDAHLAGLSASEHGHGVGGVGRSAAWHAHRAHPPPAAKPVSLGLEVGRRNEIVEIDRYGEAHAMGLLVGDVIVSMNGIELGRRQTLAGLLRDEFVSPGDAVRLGIRRSLDAHMERVVRVAKGEERAESRPPDSPRLLPRDRTGAKERRAAYNAAGRPRPRRDSRSGKVLSDTFCANGGAQERLL